MKEGEEDLEDTGEEEETDRMDPPVTLIQVVLEVMVDQVEEVETVVEVEQEDRVVEGETGGMLDLEVLASYRHRIHAFLFLLKLIVCVELLVVKGVEVGGVREEQEDWEE